MKLYFQNAYLGDIDNQFFDQPQVHGLFRARPEAEGFQRFFAWMVDEDSFSKDRLFADELLDESNDFIAAKTSWRDSPRHGAPWSIA